MHILVTGGTGFIGSHLIPALLSEGHNVYILKRQSSDTTRLTPWLKQIMFVNCDTWQHIEELFNTHHIDGIIHLATTYIKQTNRTSDISAMTKTNIDFPAQLLQLAHNHQIKFFINTGTCFEYQTSNKPVSEESPINPYNYYAATKLSFETILRYFAESDRMKALTLRLFYPYGPRDHDKLIPFLLDSIFQGRSLELTKGAQQIPYTYASDIVDAFIKSIRYITSPEYDRYTVFNIGTSNPTTIKSIIDTLSNIAGKPLPVQFTKPYAVNEIMYMACDYSKAKKLLGWEPKVNLAEGLQKTYDEYQKEHS